MTPKQAANQLRGLLQTTYLESNGELVEMVRDIVKLLDCMHSFQICLPSIKATQ